MELRLKKQKHWDSYPESLNTSKTAWFSEKAHSPTTLQKERTSVHQKAGTQIIKQSFRSVPPKLHLMISLFHSPRYKPKFRNVTPGQIFQRNTKDLWTADHQSLPFLLKTLDRDPIKDLKVEPNDIAVCKLHDLTGNKEKPKHINGLSPWYHNLCKLSNE